MHFVEKRRRKFLTGSIQVEVKVHPGSSKGARTVGDHEYPLKNRGETTLDVYSQDPRLMGKQTLIGFVASPGLPQNRPM
jgi:hypothetical protein